MAKANCCSCPPAPPNTPQDASKGNKCVVPPEVMICFLKVKKPCPAGKQAPQQQQQQKDKAKDQQEESKVTPSKSRELRAGIMYMGCDCEKRNGMQDDCRRSECQMNPACLTKPKPTCGPSEFSNAKHLMIKTENWKKCREEEKRKIEEKRKEKEEAGSGKKPGGGGAANKGSEGSDECEYECIPAYLDMSGNLCTC